MAGEKCSLCGKDAAFYSNYLKQYLCKKHLEKMLFRRINTTLLSAGLRKSAYSVPKGDSPGARMLQFMFRNNTGEGVKLEANTLDDFAAALMSHFAFSRKIRISISSPRRFNPLYTTSDEEISALLSIKGIKFSGKKRDREDLYALEMLSDLERRRPGAMLSIVKVGARLGLI